MHTYVYTSKLSIIIDMHDLLYTVIASWLVMYPLHTYVHGMSSILHNIIIMQSLA